MADSGLSGGLSGMMPNVSMSAVLNGIMWFMIGAVIVGILGLVTWYLVRKKKYGMYRVEVFDKDSNGNVYKTYDRAGIFLDKRTGYRLLFLEKAKVGMNPNNVPYVSHLDKKKRIVKTVYLRRIGVNNYVFISVDLLGMPKFTMGEEDFNNAAQEMSKIRRTYDKKSWLDKFLAPILFIASILIIMIILLSLFNKFSVIDDASKNLVEVSKMQLQITGLLFNISNSTQLYTGPMIPTTIIKPSGSGG